MRPIEISATTPPNSFLRLSETSLRTLSPPHSAFRASSTFDKKSSHNPNFWNVDISIDQEIRPKTKERSIRLQAVATQTVFPSLAFRSVHERFERLHF